MPNIDNNSHNTYSSNVLQNSSVEVLEVVASVEEFIPDGGYLDKFLEEPVASSRTQNQPEAHPDFSERYFFFQIDHIEDLVSILPRHPVLRIKKKSMFNE